MFVHTTHIAGIRWRVLNQESEYHMADTMNADARQKKAAKCDRIFLDQEGEPHSRAFTEVVAVKLLFHATPTSAERSLVMNLDDVPPGVMRAAAAFGINTSVGNTFGAERDPNEAYQLACDRWATLREGDWSADRQTGPRTSDLVEALCRYSATQGHTVDEAFRARLKQKCGDEAQRKAWESNAQVQVHLMALRKERAEENARKALEAASAAGEAQPVTGLTD